MDTVAAFGSIATVIGALLLGLAWLLWRQHRRLIASLVTTTGRIVEIRESEVDGQLMYRPVVEYAAPGREQPLRAIESHVFHGSVRWQLGDPHVVYYHPSAPENALLSHETGSRFGAQLCGLFGGTSFVLGAAALIGYALEPDNAYGAFVRSAFD